MTTTARVVTPFVSRQMPTFAEISNTAEGFRAVPQVSREDVRLLWHSDYWDGPRSGMLELNGERCWFQVIAENEDEDLHGWYRRFVVVRLTADQLAEEDRWHALFRENVGWHNDYVAGLPGRYEGLRPREQWQAFYDPYKNRVPLDLSSDEVLAWFEH
jgi:hypothetical protein